MPAFDDEDSLHGEPPYRARNSRGGGGGDDDSWDVEDEGPEDWDLVPDEMPMAPCCRCRKLIFEDSVRCPYCKWLQTQEHWRKRPLWFVAAALLALIAFGSGLAIAALHLATWMLAR